MWITRRSRQSRPDPIRSDPIQSDPIRSDPIRSDPSENEKIKETNFYTKKLAGKQTQDENNAIFTNVFKIQIWIQVFAK
jgi:hypothetical protein